MARHACLRPTLQHRVGETPTSFASRLALLHLPREGDARAFCADMGIAFGDLVRGCPEAVTELAEIAGVDAENLVADAFRQVHDGHVHRGELFPNGSLLRTALRFCPVCLLEDRSRAARPEVAAYGRALWSITSMRTCSEHCVGLVECAPGGHSKHHDFAQLVRPLLPDLHAIAERAPRLQASAMETYAIERLDGHVGQTPWLDGMPLHVAMTMCEIIGLVDGFGRDVRCSALSADDWVAAGNRGFRIASGGTASFGDFLRELIRTYPYSRSANEGPQAVFGHLFKMIAFRTPHPDFDAVRDWLRNFIVEHMPIGPGDVLFGKPVERRVIHSVHSASQELKVHPKRLKKALRAAGVLTREQAELASGNAIFDAEASAGILQDIADGLFMNEIGEYLGTGRAQTQVLVDSGLVSPMFEKQADLDHCFRRRDLDGFLERLFLHSVPVDEPDEDMVDVGKAVKKANCSTLEIVDLLLDRKLAWVGRKTGVHGFAALLVRVSEIRSIVRGSMDGWLTARKIEVAMGSSTKVVRNLIDLGYLKTEVIVSPLNRCPVTVIRPAVFEEFRREYVSLFEAMKQTGIHALTIRNRLSAVGIEPAICREKVGAAFYRRSDLDNL